MDMTAFKQAVDRAARAAGVDCFELYSRQSGSMELEAYRGAVEKFSSSQTLGVCLRVLCGGRMGYAGTQVLSEQEAQRLVGDAIDSAKVAENADIDEILPGESRPAADSQAERDPYPALKEAVLAGEAACLEGDGRVSAVADAGTAAAWSRRAIYNSQGLDVSDESHYAYAVMGPVVRQGGDTYNEYEIDYADSSAALDTAATARRAVESTLSFIGSQPVAAGSYAVALSPKVSYDLLETFCGLFSGLAAYKGLSLLGDKVGTAVAAACVDLIDDPLYPGAICRRAFDDQGFATQKTAVIAGGVLATLLHNQKTAALMGAQNTGNAYKGSYMSPLTVAPTNLYLAPGHCTQKELLASREELLYITNVKGLHAGANPTTGDFSLESKGFLYQNGRRVRPVSQITVAGNYYRLLLDIAALADDLTFSLPGGAGQFGSPTVLVDRLSVSGESGQ